MLVITSFMASEILLVPAVFVVSISSTSPFIISESFSWRESAKEE
jgi:hypothetical protein